MKKYTPLIAALGLFLFAAVLYIKDMSMIVPGSVIVQAADESPDDRGVVIHLEESISPDFIVNINTADLQELIALPQIGEVRAKAIIDYREMYGDFISINELSEVDGISENLLDKIHTYITV